MALRVLKFGGSSVADAPAILAVARRTASIRRKGHDVVVVLSAMGDATDRLLDLAREVGRDPPKRELDMLLATGEQVSIALMAIALHELGLEATSLTGGQVGLTTSESHTRARVRAIDTKRIRRHLKLGKVVIVAGFQGVTESGQITTLGRGGSDTTAVALAAVLGAEVCDIFTDVDGVHTADPRVVPAARKLQRISYDEMLELAVLGANVMHARAVVCGKRFGVPIHVRHSRKLERGTMIVRETQEMEDCSVIGCALKHDLGRVSLQNLPKVPALQARIFAVIGNTQVLVDDIIQTESADTTSLSFTVEQGDLADVKPDLEQLLLRLGSGKLVIDVGLAKVSVVGLGMRTHSGVAARMFQALGDAGVNIANITTSEIRISCLIAQADGENALRAIHNAFGLDEAHENMADGAPETLDGSAPVVVHTEAVPRKASSRPDDLDRSAATVR